MSSKTQTLSLLLMLVLASSGRWSSTWDDCYGAFRYRDGKVEEASSELRLLMDRLGLYHTSDVFDCHSHDPGCQTFTCWSKCNGSAIFVVKGCAVRSKKGYSELAGYCRRLDGVGNVPNRVECNKYKIKWRSRIVLRHRCVAVFCAVMLIH